MLDWCLADTVAPVADDIATYAIKAYIIVFGTCLLLWCQVEDMMATCSNLFSIHMDGTVVMCWGCMLF